MFPYGIIDLHCDTLTAFQKQSTPKDTLNCERAHFSLSGVPRQSHWAQCCAIFLPDELRDQAAVEYYNRHRQSFQRQMDNFSRNFG